VLERRRERLRQHFGERLQRHAEVRIRIRMDVSGERVVFEHARSMHLSFRHGEDLVLDGAPVRRRVLRELGLPPIFGP